VENSDDWRFLHEQVGLDKKTVILIRGIGVDVKRFLPSPENTGETSTVTLVSRMLWPKGVGELVEATRILRERGWPLRVQLVGTPDTSSRVSVPQDQLLEWQSEGVIDWLGYRDDVAELWRHSHIAVLPSYYREGIPRSLLEAAACARAIVTTDMPGCREIVRAGHNGLLVPPRDPHALADAIEHLLKNAETRQRMGKAGRELVEREFAEEHVVAQTLGVYRKLLDERKGAASC
jgi:glycosyltransferase involved in cell wall biosynthesis